MRLALSLILCLAAMPAWGSEAADLAKLVVAAYGGNEAIERSGSFKQSGTLDSFRYGRTGGIERTFSRPDRLRIEIRIPGAPPESRILDGDRGWRDGREVPPMMAKAMRLQAARLDLPYLILMAGETIKPFALNNAGKSDLRGLEIPMADGLRMIAVVDAKTGHIVSSHGLIPFAPNQAMEFAARYFGFKEMNGMMLATEEALFAQGQPTGKTVLKTSEIVRNLPDTAFRP